ncbi:MAG: DUF2357 domain-containing protein [Clostridiales bacterium]|nr:DUF2357 domain-containing protein [Clostridiales bacterium]
MELEIIDSYSKEKKMLSLIQKEEDLYNDYIQSIFFENRKYVVNVDLTGYDDIQDVNIYIGDIRLNTDYDVERQRVCGLADYIFIDCFDITKIQVEILFVDDEIEVFTTHYIRIAVPKTTNLYIKNMLNDIENNYSHVLEVCFSKNKKRSGISEKGNKGLETTFELLNEVYKVFKDVYPFFQNSVNKRIDNKQNIVNVQDINNISVENLNWIFRHPESMKETNIPSSLIFNRKYYQIEKIKSEQPCVSNNTYENQVILGFIDHILKYLGDLKLDLENKIKEYSKEIPEDVRGQLPSDYDLAYNCVLFYYKEINNKATECLEMYSVLFDAYNKCLECEVRTINAIPRYTFAFRQRFHYRQCFEAIVKWFEAGQYNLLTCDYLFKLKKLSRIFEYYTLLKIQEGIECNGGVLLKSDKISYEQVNIESDINNYYQYMQTNNSAMKIEVFYEPYIYRDKIKTGIDLYSTGYTILKQMKVNKYWTPDFLIKISIEDKSTYFVLDSKFSSFETVKKHRMVDLVNKYVFGIASMNQYHSQILGVWGIYPSMENKNMNLKRNNVKSSKLSLPIIEIHALQTDQNSMPELFQKIFEISKEYVEEL